VKEELATHLEDTYLSLRAQGVSEPDAIRLACEQVPSWQELRRGILAAKWEAFMQNRVWQLWVPGLVTSLSAYVVLALLQWAGIHLTVSHPGEPRAIFFYGPWILCLPVIGAIGASLSRRAQGTGWHAYLAASFPAVALAVLFLILLPLAFVLDRQVPLEIKGTALGAGMISWVILPGVALSAGAALQSLRRPRAPSH